MGNQSELPPKARAPEPLISREGQLDPYPFFAEKRKTEPVSYDENRGVWDVFTYDEVDEVISNHEVFTRNVPEPLFGDGLNYVNPPKHTRIRGALNEYFQPGRLRESQSEFETIAENLLEDALADGPEIDFAQAFAIALPIVVIAEILGIPPERRDTFREWSKAVGAAPNDRTPEAIRETARAREQALEELTEFFSDEIARREENPSDDLISKMVHEKGDVLDTSETLTQCVLFLHAGNVTTGSLISNAMWTFKEQGLYQDVRSGKIPLDGALDEVLRYRSPVKALPRVAREDVEVAGTEIPEGSPIMAWIGSANRDETQFDGADEFRPTRTPNRHIAFGDGIHVCIGAPLANLEARVAMEVLFEYVEDYEFSVDELEPMYAGTVYGLDRFPMTVTT